MQIVVTHFVIIQFVELKKTFENPLLKKEEEKKIATAVLEINTNSNLTYIAGSFTIGKSSLGACMSKINLKFEKS